MEHDLAAPTPLHLRPMTGEEYAFWRAQSVPAYAADKVRSGRWTEAEALTQAQHEFSGLLPAGLQTPGHWLYTLQTEAAPSVGALWLARAEHASGPIGYIYDLVVWPQHRRAGLAAQAMRALEQVALELGFKGLALHVFGHNTSAWQLYVKLGYAPTSINMFKPLA